MEPSSIPSDQPSSLPSHVPSVLPTQIPSSEPSMKPTPRPTKQPRIRKKRMGKKKMMMSDKVMQRNEKRRADKTEPVMNPGRIPGQKHTATAPPTKEMTPAEGPSNMMVIELLSVFGLNDPTADGAIRASYHRASQWLLLAS